MSYNIDTSKPESFLPAAAAGNFPITYNKLQDLADHHTEIMDTLSPQVRQRVESLKEIQGQHDELEATFLEERKELEAKYQKLYEPLYTKRFEIVSGVVEVDGVTTDTSLEQDKTNEGKGVPDFWLTALKTNEIMAEEISERDEDALKYLKDIKCSRIDSPKGFKLDFLFDTNPFFKNPVLTKTYHMVDEDEPILEKAIGTQIEWYPGKCLTQKTLKKKPKKGAKNAKTITKTENCESFFNFFSPPEVPDQDQDNIDEDEAEELQNLMEQDYDIGSTIRDKIIPYAVSWFTGEAVDDGELDMVDDTEEEEDEDDDANEKVDEEEVESTKKKSDVARAGESQQGQGQRGRGRAGLGQQGRGRGRVGEGQQGVVGLGQQGRGRVVEGQQWRRVVEAQQAAGRVREGRLGQIEEGQQGGVGEGEVGQTPECKQQ